MSTLKVNTVQHNSSGFNNLVQFTNSSGTQNGVLCRAWVNFQGTSTVTIRDDFNVSSITDHGTGDYTVNLSNAVTNSNHAAFLQGSGQTNGWHAVGFTYYIRNTYSSSAVACGFFKLDNSGARADQTIANVAVFGS